MCYLGADTSLGLWRSVKNTRERKHISIAVQSSPVVLEAPVV